MRFLKSVALTLPFSLVTCPLGVPVAILHGIGVASFAILVQLPLLILRNLGSILLSPFKMIGGAVKYRTEIGKELWMFARSFVAYPSVFAQSVSRAESDKSYDPTIGPMLGLPISLFIIDLASTTAVEYFKLGYSQQSDGFNLFLRQHAIPIMALGACQIFSLLYELGKAYWTSGASQPEMAEEKPMAPQSFVTMMGKIGEKDRLDVTEAKSLFGEVAELVKNDKVNLKEADQLLKMIYRVVPAPAVIA